MRTTTVDTYVKAVSRFARHFNKSPDQLGPEQVREYLLHLRNDKADSWNTIQVNRGALKSLYARVLKQPWFEDEIAAPKRRPQHPTVLSVEQITRILDCTHNLKHWTIIATLYAIGLRCNELRHLKVTDIDSRQMLLHVREGKGCVAREIGLSPALLECYGLICRDSGLVHVALPESTHIAAQPRRSQRWYSRAAQWESDYSCDGRAYVVGVDWRWVLMLDKSVWTKNSPVGFALPS